MTSYITNQPQTTTKPINNIPSVIKKTVTNQDAQTTIREIKRKTNPKNINVSVHLIKPMKNGGRDIKTKNWDQI